jgi:hypothetical protein
MVVRFGLSARSLKTEIYGSIYYVSCFVQQQQHSWEQTKHVGPYLMFSFLKADDSAAVGLASRHMIIRFNEHGYTNGPLARTVKNAAYILQKIAGVNPRDNYTSTIPGGAIPDYVSARKSLALSGVRTGVP